MTNLEIAHKHDVTTFETSKELDWQGETNYAYLVDTVELGRKYEDRFVKIGMIEKSKDLIIAFCPTYLVTITRKLSETRILYAPQMHEIAPLLPMEIDNKQAKKYIRKYIKENQLDRFETLANNDFLDFKLEIDSSYSGLCYCVACYSKCINIFEVEIKNNHFAQAYAELYLKLKKANLI